MTQHNRMYRRAMYQRSRYLTVPLRTDSPKSKGGQELDNGMNPLRTRSTYDIANSNFKKSINQKVKSGDQEFILILSPPPPENKCTCECTCHRRDTDGDSMFYDKPSNGYVKKDGSDSWKSYRHTNGTMGNTCKRIINCRRLGPAKTDEKKLENTDQSSRPCVRNPRVFHKSKMIQNDHLAPAHYLDLESLSVPKEQINSGADMIVDWRWIHGIVTDDMRGLADDRVPGSNKGGISYNGLLNGPSHKWCRDIGHKHREIGFKSLERQIKNENIYRGLIRCMLHPLGIPDNTQGLRPGDLLDHLRVVFEVDRDEHEFFVREELENKPSDLQVNLTLVEGSGLKPIKEKETCNPYCLVSIVNPQHKSSKMSPKHSPKGSPRVSPRVSPKFIKKLSMISNSPQGSLEGEESPHTPKYKKHLASPSNSPLNSQDGEDVLRSRTIHQTTSPLWNEEFQLPVNDYLTDEVHIYVFDQESGVDGDNKHQHRDSHHGLRHLFRSLLHLPEYEHCDLCLIGRLVIPVRDILATGVDCWYGLTSSSGKNMKGASGKCRVKLSLSHRQDFYLDGSFFTVEDYYLAAQQVYRYTFQAAMELSVTMGADLKEADQRILDMICLSHSISPLSQSLVHVIVMLECATDNDNITINEQALSKAMHDLQMIWVAKQLNITNVEQRMPISDTEIVMYRKAASKYIMMICNHLENLPDLFPPSMDNIKTLQSKLGVTIQLLEMDLWETKASPHKDLMHKVLNKLEIDVNGWIEEKLSMIHKHELVKDNVIPELTTLGEIISSASSHCNMLGVVRNFFNSIGIGYYRVVSFAVERKISTKIRELMIEMDRYQKRYHTYHINITASSRLSLRIYFATRKFHSIIRDNVSRRDVFRLTISQYQHWFQETLVFWLQAFRTECTNRIERSLEIEKDVVMATLLVKYSNSSIDVLSCFAKITEEWRQIDFHDPDSSLMGITKITDLICDGARLYSDRIHCILERNGYYDDKEEVFDVTDRLCITLNNIEHVRQYLTELPQLLEWESICVLVSTKHENDDIGNQAMATLNRLIHSTDNEILLKSSMLIMQIIEKMKVDIARFMELFTQKRPEKVSSVDQLLVYLSSSLKTFHDKLMSSIYPLMIGELWTTMVTLFNEQLRTGERPEYYIQMKQHLRALTSYFARGGLDINRPVYIDLKSRLDANSMVTEDLMLEYFDSFSSSLGTPTEYFGHIAIKLAYLEETRGNVTVYVKVIRGSDLPGLDTSGLSDPYILITLHPRTMFGHLKVRKTKTVEQTLNPVFNTTFQFPNVPKEYLLVRGAVMLMSVMDHDRIGYDDFAGEIVIPLSTIPKIDMTMTVESTPVVMLPIKRPKNCKSGPYQVLRERSAWDKTAKLFVTERQKYLEQQPERTDKPSKLSNFFSFFSGKNS